MTLSNCGECSVCVALLQESQIILWWGDHHLIIDGWGNSQILQLFSNYLTTDISFLFGTLRCVQESSYWQPAAVKQRLKELWDEKDSSITCVDVHARTRKPEPFDRPAKKTVLVVSAVKTMSDCKYADVWIKLPRVHICVPCIEAQAFRRTTKL